MTTDSRAELNELVSDVLSEWHYDHEHLGTREHNKHGSFSDSLALTHCICWGAGSMVGGRLLARLRESEVRESALAAEVEELTAAVEADFETKREIFARESALRSALARFGDIELNAKPIPGCYVVDADVFDEASAGAARVLLEDTDD